MAKRKLTAQAVSPLVRMGGKKKRRQAARAAVQATVGKNPTQWTTNDMKALLTAVLYQADALDENLTVKPLSEWLRN